MLVGRGNSTGPIGKSLAPALGIAVIIFRLAPVAPLPMEDPPHPAFRASQASSFARAPLVAGFMAAS
jgi:hypothetical protein